MIRGAYFENPGMPTDEEWGTYCPHGEKILEATPETRGRGYDRVGEIVEPWPCHRPGCTRGKFETELAAMEAELAESYADAARLQYE